MDDAAGVERVQRGRRLDAVPQQVGVALVLEDRDVVFARERDQRVAAIQRQDRRGGVLDGRDRVDEFRRDAAAPSARPIAAASASITMPSASSFMPSIFAPSLAEAVHRALVAEFLDEHGVARIDQQLADHVEALAGAGEDHHVLDRRLDAALASRLVGDELAQPGIALRAEAEVVDREFASLRGAAPRRQLRSVPRSGSVRGRCCHRRNSIWETAPSAAPDPAGRRCTAYRSRSWWRSWVRFLRLVETEVSNIAAGGQPLPVIRPAPGPGGVPVRCRDGCTAWRCRR